MQKLAVENHSKGGHGMEENTFLDTPTHYKTLSTVAELICTSTGRLPLQSEVPSNV